MADYDDFSTSSKEPEPLPGDGDDQSAFHALVGHALMDAQFRSDLLNPKTRAAAVKRATGKEMTDEMSKAIDEAVGSIQDLAGQFDKDSIAAT